jgi:hypothetical protein
LAVRRRDDFQIAAHELIGAIVVIHEVFGHALRTKHFDSVMEAQSPPAYKSINDKTPNDEQVVWKDGVSGGGEAGTWIEDAGIGGVFGCVVKKQNVCHFSITNTRPNICYSSS